MTASWTRRRLSRRRAAGTLVLALLGAALWWLAGPSQLGGPASYVTTRGVSMAPEFNGGDLAIVRSASSYRVGDVAAYHSQLFHTVVMHRIVAQHGDHYTFKGDNNSWFDPEKPAAGQLIGKQVVRIPHLGGWLHHLVSPATLGFIAFLLVAGGGATVERRRRRHRRKRTAMTPITPRRHNSTDAVATLTPYQQVAAAATLCVGLLALVLTTFAWATPVRQMSTTDQQSPRQMTFAYSAQVPKSAAYDGTRAASPQPIFRKLADAVDVTYSYQGPPGSISMKAVLSTASGWTSTVPLQAATRFTERTYVGRTTLQLSALQARANAAARATGMPGGQVTVTLAPSVTSTSGAVFTPTLGLQLDPLSLSLAGAPSTLVVKGSSTTTSRSEVSSTLSFLGIQLAVSTARIISIYLLLLSLLAAGAIVMAARRTRPSGEVEEIHRRWSSLLVRVHPVRTPQGRPVVDVTEPATLVKLAERYGLLILHWSRSDVETYVVQDDAITYRYRANAGDSTAPTSGDADTLVGASTSGP